jgi:hypothetical protein
MNRLQIFNSAPAPVWLDEPEQPSSSALRGRLERARLGLITDRSVPSLARRMTSRRLGRLARREPFSRLGATVTRPVGDAVVTLQILRIR